MCYSPEQKVKCYCLDQILSITWSTPTPSGQKYTLHTVLNINREKGQTMSTLKIHAIYLLWFNFIFYCTFKLFFFLSILIILICFIISFVLFLFLWCNSLKLFYCLHLCFLIIILSVIFKAQRCCISFEWISQNHLPYLVKCSGSTVY